ncbi:MAG: 50S ribosomal protein L32 [Bdellovibrionales bacterium]|nr:50S ribosomal protein L32 [Bdellovibrionales bacterium]
MPTPKKKSSRMRRGHRRSHDGITAPAVVKCSSCGALSRPHRVCAECGQYAGREIQAPSN